MGLMILQLCSALTTKKKLPIWRLRQYRPTECSAADTYGSLFVASRTCAWASAIVPVMDGCGDSDLRLHFRVVHYRWNISQLMWKLREPVYRIRHTILNLPHPCLDVVQGQVAHLVLQAIQIHFSTSLKSSRKQWDGQFLGVKVGGPHKFADRRRVLCLGLDSEVPQLPTGRLQGWHT
jgi:hypothetical protein